MRGTGVWFLEGVEASWSAERSKNAGIGNDWILAQHPWETAGNLCSAMIPREGLRNSLDRQRRETLGFGGQEDPCRITFLCVRQPKEAEFDDRMHDLKTSQQQEDLSFAQRYGTPPTREANMGRERDDDYERERER